ncbi:MAG: hypothetical protein KDN18_20105 [Verrucomicrobiae bacterium]|nr:hypothetical protein [Verrucomicrobiae bacterium]
MIFWDPGLMAQEKEYFKPVLDKSKAAADAVGDGASGKGGAGGMSDEGLSEEDQMMRDRDGDGFADEMTDAEWNALGSSSEALLYDDEMAEAALTEAANEEFYERYPGMRGQQIDPGTNPELAKEWNDIKEALKVESILNTAADKEFYRRNPDMIGRKVDPANDPKMAEQWNEIKREVSEKSKLNAATDEEFYRRNPSMEGQKIDPLNDREKAEEWLQIRKEMRNSDVPDGAGLGELRLKEQRDSEMANSGSSPGNDSGTTGNSPDLANNPSGQNNSSGFLSGPANKNGGANNNLGLKEQRDSEMANPGSSTVNMSETTRNSTELANNTTNQNGGNNGNLGLKEKKDAQMLDPIPMERPQPGQLPGGGTNDPLSMDIPGLPGNESPKLENYVEKTDGQRKEEIQQAFAALDKKQMTDGQGIRNLEDHRDKYSATADDIQGVRGDLQGYREEGKSNLYGAYAYGALQGLDGVGDVVTEFIPNQAVQDSIKFSKKVAEGDPVSAISVVAGVAGLDDVKLIADSANLGFHASELRKNAMDGNGSELTDISNVLEDALILSEFDMAAGVLNGSEKILQGGKTILETRDESQHQDSMFNHVDAQAIASQDRMIQKRNTLQNDLNQLSMSDEEIRKVIEDAKSDPKYAAYLESDEFKETRAKNQSDYEQRLSLANSRNKPASVPGNQGEGTPAAPTTSQGNSFKTDADPNVLAGNTTTPQMQEKANGPGNQSGETVVMPNAQLGSAPGTDATPITLSGNTTPQTPQGQPAAPGNQGSGTPAIPPPPLGTASGTDANPNVPVGVATTAQAQGQPTVSETRNGGSTNFVTTPQGPTGNQVSLAAGNGAPQSSSLDSVNQSGGMTLDPAAPTSGGGVGSAEGSTTGQPGYSRRNFQNSALASDSAYFGKDENGQITGQKNYASLERIKDIDGQDGFQASVFRDRKTNELYIGVRGTDTNESEDRNFKSDLKADVNIAFQGGKYFNSQVAQADSLYKQIQEDYPGEKINITGHSLGGAVAQVIGAKHGIPTQTFNAPGMKTYIQENVDGAQTTNIVNHQRKSDLVSNADNLTLGALTSENVGTVVQWGSVNDTFDVRGQNGEKLNMIPTWWDTAKDAVSVAIIGKSGEVIKENAKQHVLGNHQMGFMAADAMSNVKPISGPPPVDDSAGGSMSPSSLSPNVSPINTNQSNTSRIDMLPRLKVEGGSEDDARLGMTFVRTDEKKGEEYSLTLPVGGISYGNERTIDGKETTMIGVSGGTFGVKGKKHTSQTSDGLSIEGNATIKVSKVEGKVKVENGIEVEKWQKVDPDDPLDFYDKNSLKSVSVTTEGSGEVSVKAKLPNDVTVKPSIFSIQFWKEKITFNRGINSFSSTKENQLADLELEEMRSFQRGPEAERKASLMSEKYFREYEAYSDKNSQGAKDARRRAEAWKAYSDSANR